VTLTFAELAGRAHQLSTGCGSSSPPATSWLRAAQRRRRDPVTLASQEAGLRTISLNPSLSGPEIRRILEHAGAACLVLHERFGDRAADLAGLASLRLGVAVGGTIEAFVPQDDVIAGQPTSPPDDRCLGGTISYSSGTTGDPKAIVRPMPDMDPWAFADSQKVFARAFQFLPLEGAHLISAGMHHGGCAAFYQGALHAGQALVIEDRFDPEETLRLIERHRVTTGYLVPTQFVRLLKLPHETRERYDHSSLQVIVTPPRLPDRDQAPDVRLNRPRSGRRGARRCHHRGHPLAEKLARR
jgi:long-chain acyl-CoA synthetase